MEHFTARRLSIIYDETVAHVLYLFIYVFRGSDPLSINPYTTTHETHAPTFNEMMSAVDRKRIRRTDRFIAHTHTHEAHTIHNISPQVLIDLQL